MITLAELITSIRYKLGDMQGAKYSDHELANAINRACKLLYNRMGQKFIYSSVRSASVIVDDGIGILPADFGAIKSIKDEAGNELHVPQASHSWQPSYRITDDELHAQDGVYKIEYYKIPFNLNNKNDPADVPESMNNYIVEIAAAILAGESEAAEAFVQTACNSLAWGNVNHPCNFGPLQIWGGKG